MPIGKPGGRTTAAVMAAWYLAAAAADKSVAEAGMVVVGVVVGAEVILAAWAWRAAKADVEAPAELNRAWVCAACNAANVVLVVVADVNGLLLLDADGVAATELEVWVFKCPWRSSLELNLRPQTSPLLVQLQTTGGAGGVTPAAAAAAGELVVLGGGVVSVGGKKTLAGGGTPIKNAEKAAPVGQEGSAQ